jgi:hypothetical protein
LWSAHFYTIIRAVKPNRMEHEMPVFCWLIAQKLAIHEICGRLLEQFRHELLERLWVRTVPPTVPLQRNGGD